MKRSVSFSFGTSPQLLTDTDKQMFVYELLGKQFKHAGKLFAQKDVYYTSVNGLGLFIQDLFTWLKVPKQVVVIKYGRVEHGWQSELHANRFTLHIDTRCKNRPFVAMAYAASAVMYDYFSIRAPISVEPFLKSELVERAAIEAGLGVVILNGISDQSRLGRRRVAGVLTGLSEAHFIELFLAYCRTNHLRPMQIADQLLPRSQKLLSNFGWKKPTKQKRNDFIKTEVEQYRISRLKMSGSASLVLLVLATGVFVMLQRPRMLSASQAEKYYQIQQTYQMYHTCLRSVESLKSRTFQRDVLNERTIAAETSRCQSLKNEHNYAVEEFNASLR